MNKLDLSQEYKVGLTSTNQGITPFQKNKGQTHLIASTGAKKKKKASGKTQHPLMRKAEMFL